MPIFLVYSLFKINTSEFLSIIYMEIFVKYRTTSMSPIIASFKLVLKSAEHIFRFRSPSYIRKTPSCLVLKNLESRRRRSTKTLADTLEIGRADRWLPQISFPYGVESFSANISSHSLKASSRTTSSRMASNLQFK